MAIATVWQGKFLFVMEFPLDSNLFKAGIMYMYLYSFRLGESCSHIGALLFKLEAAVRLGYNKIACTSAPCKWNDDYVKKVRAKKIKDISFYKKKKPIKIKEYSPSNEEQQIEMIRALKQLPINQQPIALSSYQEYGQKYVFNTDDKIVKNPKIPKSLRGYYLLNPSEKDIAESLRNMYSLVVTDEDRDFVQKSTILQSNSLLWNKLRIGRITASSAHDVLHTCFENPSTSLIKRICMEGKKLNVPSLNWGIENESKALETYKSLIENDHIDLKFEKAGLLLDKKYHVLGASADAIGQCQCHGKFIIEVKCPFKHRHAKSINDCISDKMFCLDNELKLKSNHRYMTQVQMQMHIYNISNCHFLIWNSQFSHAVEISYKDFNEKMDRLFQFHEKYIGPELITRRVEGSLASNEETLKEDNTLYCYCNQPYNENEEMIGCDNPSCKIKWVHYDCANIKKAPKGKWFCKYCK